MLAADLQLGVQEEGPLALHGEFDTGLSEPPLVAEGEGGAEGEAAPDLVQFAKDLAAAGAKFYGASWCPHCTAQKEDFEDGGQFLPFIEVTNLDAGITLNFVGQGGISPLNPGDPVTSFPTWEFADGTRLVGQQTLETLSQASGVPIPSSDIPFIAPIKTTDSDIDKDNIRDDVDDDYFNDGVPNDQAKPVFCHPQRISRVDDDLANQGTKGLKDISNGFPR